MNHLINELENTNLKLKALQSSDTESESFSQPLVELKYPEESIVDTVVVPIEASIKDQPYYRIEHLALKLDIHDESAVEIIVNNKGEKCKESAEIVYKQILEKLEKLGYDGDYTFKDALDFAKKIYESCNDVCDSRSELCDTNAKDPSI